ncbi:hypothetical protein HMPREF0682_2121 [Propionibacterium acidifaciens F0233]|uniref:Uncharacterized protein n=1 Tax=Propionibacterium acidifaciens F0233 TaxID=553198 RepID=U2S028_9ACTN|nr:hypothetical protein HMPREF0682_2121 [Propionibacterium acidifaciens F0233]
MQPGRITQPRPAEPLVGGPAGVLATGVLAIGGQQGDVPVRGASGQ